MSLSKYPSALDDDSNMPDRVPFVDLYEAAHINLVQDAVKAIEAELGANPSGNLATLKDRIAGVIDEDGKLIPYFPGNVLTVGPDHCHFTSVQAAIDSIEDASAQKKYTILIYPGVYSENVTLKQYVSLFGYNKRNTTIQGKLTPATHTIIYNLTIQKALPNDYLVDTSNCYDLIFSHVDIINDDEGGAVTNSGSSVGVHFYHSTLRSANEDDFDYYAYHTTGKSADFFYCTLEIGCKSAVYFDSNSSGSPRFEHCRFNGGDAGISWASDGHPIPTVLFSFFSSSHHALDAPSSKGSFVSNIVANCDYDSILHNVDNYAQHPILATIYEE